MVKILSQSQTNILLHLARYKFLTTSQMICLGVSNRRSNLSVMLKPLKESKRPFIGEMQFSFVPTKGRLENFYFLKPKGKKLLIESGLLTEDDIKIPKGRTVLFTQDYFHRKYTIDCHISCDISAKNRGIEVLEFDRYFDKTGNNRTGKNLQAKTKLQIGGEYLIADGSILIEKEGVSRLFAFEFYNDKNTKRICQQIEKHIQGIKESSLCRNYGILKGHRLLAVFREFSTLENVKNKLKVKSGNQYLLFGTFEQIQQNFFSNWLNINSRTIEIEI